MTCVSISSIPGVDCGGNRLTKECINPQNTISLSIWFLDIKMYFSPDYHVICFSDSFALPVIFLSLWGYALTSLIVPLLDPVLPAGLIQITVLILTAHVVRLEAALVESTHSITLTLTLRIVSIPCEISKLILCSVTVTSVTSVEAPVDFIV